MARFRWNLLKQQLIRVIQWYIHTNHVGYNDQSIKTNLTQLKHYLFPLKIGNNDQTFISPYPTSDLLTLNKFFSLCAKLNLCFLD